MSIDGAIVEQQARLWLGTPFVHQARLRGVGADCAGLPIGVSRELVIVAPDFDVTGYQRTPDGKSLKAYCDEYMIKIDAVVMGPGNVVLVAWRNGPPQHLGILGNYRHGGLSMIHAESRRHFKVIETRLLFSAGMRLVAVYRLPGVV